jgi:anti-sigma B factor antagonist
MALTIHSSEKDEIALVYVEGEINMFTSPQLRNTLLPLLKKKIKGIIVDFTKVSFMDSSGIATLVEGLQWSKKENKEFILTGLSTTVFNALSLTKLDNVFTIKPDTSIAFDGISNLTVP